MDYVAIAEALLQGAAAIYKAVQAKDEAAAAAALDAALEKAQAAGADLDGLMAAVYGRVKAAEDAKFGAPSEPIKSVSEVVEVLKP
jgi:hypothetical protein